MKRPELEFKVNTMSFLKEVFEHNHSMSVFKIPANVFKDLLVQIAYRASQLNDDNLNALMAQLALYAVADPYDENYNEKICQELIAKKYNHLKKTK